MTIISTQGIFICEVTRQTSTGLDCVKVERKDGDGEGISAEGERGA